MMTAITEGWAYGKRARNIQFQRWEERFSEPVSAIRQEFGLEDGELQLAA